MKFAPNRMYIESYNKCPNCGLLLYETPENAGENARAEKVVRNGKTYCSTWCIDWEEERRKRRQNESAA